MYKYPPLLKGLGKRFLIIYFKKMKHSIRYCFFILMLSFNINYAAAQDSSTVPSIPSDSTIMKHALACLSGINQEVDYEKARKLLNYLAKNEFADAFNVLGKIYQQGLGVAIDKEKAVMCYDRAHQLGSLSGTINFVRALRRGEGTTRNYELAFHLAQIAAERGHPTGYYLTGEMMLKGLGTKLDYQGSRALFEKGAELGNKECIYMLGVMHLKGYGTEPDTQKSEVYFKKAMLKGHGWVEEIIRKNEFSKEEAKHFKRRHKLKSGTISKLDTLINFKNDAQQIDMEGSWTGKFFTYDWAGKTLNEEKEVQLTTQTSGDELWVTWWEQDTPQFKIKMLRSKSSWVVQEFISLTKSPIAKHDFKQMRLSIKEENGQPILYGNALRFSNQTGDRMPPSAFALHPSNSADQENSRLFSIYPNPFTNEFNILLELNQNDFLFIEVFDSEGKSIYKQPATNYSIGVHFIPIKIVGGASGVYVVQVTGSSISKSEVLIKKNASL